MTTDKEWIVQINVTVIVKNAKNQGEAWEKAELAVSETEGGYIVASSNPDVVVEDYEAQEPV